MNTHKSTFFDWFVKYNIWLILLLLILVSTWLSDAFLTERNLYNLMRQLVPLCLVSLGMLLVVLTGGIDLSVGSIAAVGGMAVSMALPFGPGGGGFGLLFCVTLAVVVGAFLGAITGTLVAVFRMAPFIASLAMMTMARGLAFMMSNGQPVRLPRELDATRILKEFGSKGVPGIGLPWPVVMAIVVILAFIILLRRTKFGRLTIATGSNEVAVRLAGLPVARYKFAVYAIAGALAGMAGVVATSRTAVGTANIGSGLELDAIAACVIGGALLSGGKGSVINTVVGVCILGLIGNIMNLLSVPAYPQQIIKGLIILLAVLLQSAASKSERV
ncbi:ABC transporter permease [Celeribacter halophilus]|uniref:ABC transporter permease n=1 Tax=Celeribacter halophilus TaxID=576117 RepID=UPI003A909327